MTPFIDGYARRLLGDPDFQLAPGEIDDLLALAREIAHGTERVNAPLATYVAGLRAGAAAADPAGRWSAAASALDTARRMLVEATAAD